MDAHRAISPGWLTPQRIVAILVIIVWMWCNPVFASPVRIYGGSFNLPLLDPVGPGSAMTEAAIEVPDHFVIADLDVRIDITHTHVFDLQLFLQNPSGNRLCLNKYEFTEFFNGENYTNTVFDDKAVIPIEEGKPPFTGRFRPEAGYLLESFDGQDTYGTWLMQIYDMWPADTGTLNIFELIFTEIPEPATAILLVFATFLAVLKEPQRKL